MMRPRNRERPEKILVAMLRLSKRTTRPLKYEDIVVEAFKTFPDEFALRGHPEYPDSSDIHKPLYGVLKRQGLVRSANKTFSLTARGLERASQLSAAAGDALDDARDANRMARDARAEVERMLTSDAYRLFVNGQRERILDTDLYQFLGCTVRTQRNDFVGRLAASDDAVKAAARHGEPDRDAAGELEKLWAFLTSKFQGLIEKRRGGRDG